MSANKADWEYVQKLESENARLREILKTIDVVVKNQAEDKGLWFIAQTAPEGYLQQELRRLHRVIEERFSALEGDGYGK